MIKRAVFDYPAPTTRTILDLSTVTRSMALLSLDVRRETNSCSSQEREAVLLLYDIYYKPGKYELYYKPNSSAMDFPRRHFVENNCGRRVAMRRPLTVQCARRTGSGWEVLHIYLEHVHVNVCKTWIVYEKQACSYFLKRYTTMYPPECFL